MSVQNFMAIYLIVLEIFHSGPKWFPADQQSNIAIPRYMQKAWLKTTQYMVMFVIWSFNQFEILRGQKVQAETSTVSRILQTSTPPINHQGKLLLPWD